MVPVSQTGRLWLTGGQLAQGLGADEGAVRPPHPDGAVPSACPLSSASLCGPRLWGKQQGSCPRVLCRFWGVSQTLPSPQGSRGPHLIPWTSPAVSEKQGSS